MPSPLEEQMAVYKLMASKLAAGDSWCQDKGHYAPDLGGTIFWSAALLILLLGVYDLRRPSVAMKAILFFLGLSAAIIETVLKHKFLLCATRDPTSRAWAEFVLWNIFKWLAVAFLGLKWSPAVTKERIKKSGADLARISTLTNSFLMITGEAITPPSSPGPSSPRASADTELGHSSGAAHANIGSGTASFRGAAASSSNQQ